MRDVSRIAARKLTARQQRFVDAILGGETIAGAYRVAYTHEGMSPKAVRTEASRVNANPIVSRAIEAGRAAQEREKRRNGANRARGIISRLDAIADDIEQPGSVRVQALKVLAQEAGMLTTTSKLEVTTKTPETEAETLDELENTLREALAANQ